MVTDKICAFDELIFLLRDLYGGEKIPLHRPIFEGREREYIIDCIDSNFVSSVGTRVREFENCCAKYTDIKYGIATINGTAALHAALKVADVQQGDEVITQALTFVATCNAISYCGAQPVFIDVDRDTMGLSPVALEDWLASNTRLCNGSTYNKKTGSRIAACVPMHTFGHPLRIAEVVKICEEYGIIVIEDCAEALGSFIGDRHTGSFGKLAALSFNGNKVITAGNGGMILTNDTNMAKHALHLTTTAKVPHLYEFIHDQTGYNYRLANINAALGCAQMENLSAILKIKSMIAEKFRAFCMVHGLNFVDGRDGTSPNYWLNSIILESLDERNLFLEYMNENGIMSRPIWRLMNRLDMFKGCQTDGLKNSQWLEDRVANIPSSVPEGSVKNIKND